MSSLTHDLSFHDAAGWWLRVYPTAGEVGGSFRRASASTSAPKSGDPERSRLEAARRARTKLRRYCAANGLNRLGTLTYAPEWEHRFDPVAVRRDVGVFFRALRTALRSNAFPYAWVPEWHPGGHGLHLHFAVGRYVRKSLIERTWGRGIVNIKLLGDLPVGSTALHEARVAARYLGKYVGKDFDDKPAGVHRYDVAQGFQPESVVVFRRSIHAALDQACELMGGRPVTTWHSDQQPNWQGPPAVWAQWR